MESSLVVGVTAGIAAFKTAALVSRLVQQDYDVTVVMTRDARRFVSVDTFAALTGHVVGVETFDSQHFPLGAHIELARRAQLLCIAPATADFLAKTAHGLADDLLSTLYLAFTGPVLMAPAMNASMWAKPAVQRNVRQLAEDGVNLLLPESGWLSCREQGAGRMVEPEVIYDQVVAALTDSDCAPES